MFFYWLCWTLVYLPVRLFYPTFMKGRKNLPKKQRAILACNHSTNMDPVILFSHLHRRPYILAKHTLFKNKFVGAVMRSYGGIPVNRQEVGPSTVRAVYKVLKDNNWMCIFPEGTRKASMEEGNAIKNGLAMFSLKTNSPIVPMWFLKKPRFLRFNKLLVGEPFYLTQFEGQKITKELLVDASKFITDKMQSLKDEYLAQVQAKKKKKAKAQ